MPTVGDVRFAAIEQKTAIGLLHGCGFDALQIAASRGFGHGDGADHLTRGQLGQVMVFLRISSVVQQVRRHDFRMQSVPDPSEAACAQLFNLHH